MRITKKGEPVVFNCDGAVVNGACGATLRSHHYEWRDANVEMRWRGWSCYPKEGQAGLDYPEFEHACPSCYVEFCRRAGVVPYANYGDLVELVPGQRHEPAVLAAVAMHNKRLRTNTLPRSRRKERWREDDIPHDYY